MFYESIGNMEYHNFFITPYGDPIEEAVFTDLAAFVENHFGTKVKKFALIDSQGGCHNRIIEVFLYYHKDYMILDDGGLFVSPVSTNNSKIILNAAEEIISRHNAERTFDLLNVVEFRCFEAEEISYIKKRIYMSQIEDIKSLLIDDNIVRVEALYPYSSLLLFLKDNNYAEEFKQSEKCRQFHEMLYQKAKAIDTFGFIKDVSDFKEFRTYLDNRRWYYFDSEANYAPEIRWIQAYDDTLFYNKKM